MVYYSIMFNVFDLDDTLYSLRGAFDRAHKRMFPDLHVDDLGELFACVRKHSYVTLEMTAKGELKQEDEFSYRIMRAYAEHGIDLSRAECDVYEKIYREEQKNIVLFDGADKLLDHYAAVSDKIAIMTNGLVAVQMGKIERLGLKKWFSEDLIFISDDLGFPKPDERAHMEVEKRLGALPHDIRMIGDTYAADMRGAIERGWKTVWFNHRHEQLPEGAPEPDVTVYSMEELLQIK